ncbi:protein SERAC1-like [Lingula anatina]|uniref:Protein SERAC1 n=1 Tax=Lingula anatina TaxID=7574 RepID=A0A1S3HVF0_LINAN|nr:protein SERAC1-like [Lingula anatina]XP_013390016.1 protein SERAC1-like [Lingula anatina]|eukprot:XP_013390014.1 protein SERAC1-like [Lingula anatina]
MAKWKHGKIVAGTCAVTGFVGFIAVTTYLIFDIGRKLRVTTEVFETEKKKKPYIKLEAKDANGTDDDKKPFSLKDIESKLGDLFLWRDIISNNPYHLLKLTKSNDQSKRLLAVRTLAKHHHLPDYECNDIAQFADARTSIGLARAHNVDLRFFLGPPWMVVSGTRSYEVLMKLLESLPKNGIDMCTQYITDEAIKKGIYRNENVDADDVEGPWSFGGGNLSYIRLPTVQELETFFLQALVNHTMIPSHCRDIVQHNGLELFMKISYDEDSNLSIQRTIARMIGNIALHDDLHPYLVKGGWIRRLVQWRKTDDLELSSHAARALANMDRDFGWQKYEDGIYLLYPQDRLSDPVLADVVFVHGLLGGAFKTWRQADKAKTTQQEEVDKARTTQQEEANLTVKPHNLYSNAWPKDWLTEDFPNIRIVAVDFDTMLSEWRAECPFETEKRSLQARSMDLYQKLEKAGIGSRPVVFVGHSMGGLLIKQMQVFAREHPSMSKLLKNTKGVIFYSTPHFGASLAATSTQWRYILQPSVEVQELKLGSEKLNALNEDFKQVAENHKILCRSFGETQETELLKSPKLGTYTSVVVPETSSNPGFGEYYKIDTDHLNICKPLDKESQLYQLTVDFIKQCIPEYMVENIVQATMVYDEYIFPDFS